jgi:osmotically-inducible protein OsmY
MSTLQSGPQAKISPQEVKAKIRERFHRDAEVDADSVAVEVTGTKVTLRGRVHSWVEHDDAAEAARSIKGVAAVANFTEVVVPESRREVFR